jgi:hypothetical protein
VQHHENVSNVVDSCTHFAVFTSAGGRAMAQAVSHWPLTVEARVHARVNPCGICGGQSGTGTGFLRVLRFPLQIYHSTIAPYLPITAP